MARSTPSTTSPVHRCPLARAPCLRTDLGPLGHVESLTRVAVPAQPLPLPASLALSKLRPHRRRTGRRTVATVVLAPLFFLLLVTEGGGWDPERVPLWTVLVATIAAGAAATVATYLPGHGRCARNRGGLTPCAVLPMMSVLAAGWLLGAQPRAVPSAVAALAAVAFGPVHRLTCARCSA